MSDRPMTAEELDAEYMAAHREAILLGVEYRAVLRKIDENTARCQRIVLALEASLTLREPPAANDYGGKVGP